ncbi:hypothetical protein WMY93_007146 [Mugilogobius chulae]|uniref:VWFA domain-containing protein n=1 Tax=Mugilogobius chulae TaxID=88201 RepID=A0AAW0PQH3_9GOBI
MLIWSDPGVEPTTSLLGSQTVSVSWAFNIDLREPDVYDGDEEGFFGFKVLQVGSSTNKGMIVTAPLYMNGSGAVFLRKKNEEPPPPFTAENVTVGEEELPVKHFGLSIAKDLTQPQLTFAAVQFSTELRTVFTFNDYTNDTASSKLEKEEQLKGLTNTHMALDFVLKNHLNNTSSGATDGATKVLVLITDGDPRINFFNSNKWINPTQSMNEQRVWNSGHTEQGTLCVEGHSSTEQVERRKRRDLCSLFLMFFFLVGTGRSALGLGGLTDVARVPHELRGETETQIQDSELEEDSYMGYSVSVGEKNKTALYFTGAPRYKHKGQVVLFTASTNGKWSPTQRISGKQHGSYFGAEICSVDVDSDGDTDFLFVGAPLFYQTHRVAEGKIYIYKLTHKTDSETPLSEPAGKPEQRSSVSVPGDRSRGIRSTHSQRILGEKVRPGLQFFGQSIDGSSDVGNDGLPDLLIGSRGAAVVLKSKPVFNVTTRLSFEPHEINIDKIKCPSNMEDFVPLVNLTICFEMVEATKSSAGAVKPGLNISYSLDVDPTRQTFRGFFNSTTKKRNFTETYELRDRETCLKHSVYMPKCVTDTLSSIKINMNFSQVESERADAALNTDSYKEASVEVPFEKRCRQATCVAEIEVDFDFKSPFLLVADHNQFNVIVTLSNNGEDSYNTSLTIYHPTGLSFSKMNLLQDSKSKVLHRCHGIEGGTDEQRQSCSVSHPVYRSQSQAKFMIAFRVVREYDWKEFLSLNITGHSDNQNSSKGSLVKTIPVLFEIKMTLVVGEDSTTYMNFTTEHPDPKTLVTTYTVDNYGWRDFPANVTLVFPTKLEHNFEMKNYRVRVTPNITQCIEDESDFFSTDNYCSPERECKSMVCEPFILTNESVEFQLFGDVQFKGLGQDSVPFLKRYTGLDNEVEFKSFLFVAYDKEKYSLDLHNLKTNIEDSYHNIPWEDIEPSLKSESEVKIEMIILPDKMLIILTGAGGGLFLLILITVIMFKYGMEEDEEENEEEEEEEADQSETEDKDDKEDEPEENKDLLEKQEIMTDV